ncbi:hypothetical protein Tco_1540774 [Tanacetum coccineum]
MQSKEAKVDSEKILDADLVVTESSGTESKKHVSSSRSGNDTLAEDADINSVNDKQPMVEVQLSVKHNILANEQQHSVQSESIYDTYLLEKVDKNTIPDSTNMCHREGEIDQNSEKCQVSCPLLDPSFENKKLHKENEHLKQTYKDLYDSIKKIRVHKKDHNDSLIAQINSKTVENADLKAQIQEKIFANAALKNELRKLKENSVDTKFEKPLSLRKPVLQPLINQPVVRQPNAFKSERPNFLKPRFAFQVDVNTVLSKPVTHHYLLKGRESACGKPSHMIASSSSRNSSKNMPRFSSNDMVHNYYLDEGQKKAQEKDRNSESSVMHSTRLQNTTNDHKPKPRSYIQTTRSLPVFKSSCVTLKVVPLVDHSGNSSPFSDSIHFVFTTCHKCVFNANHDACITKLLKEVNSRVKVQSPKTRNNNKPVEPTSHTQKLNRQIVIGYRFSLVKSSVVHEKINSPRSCLSSGPALHEMTHATISFGLVPNLHSLTPFVPTSRTDWDLLFQSLFDELLTPLSSIDCPAPEVITPIAEVVAPKPAASTGSPSSTTVDQDAPSPSNSQTTPKTQSLVIPNDVEEDNHDLDVAHMNNDLFFSILIPENDSEASFSLDVIPTVVHTATPNSEHVTKWTKYHPLENIIGEIERPVSIRLQLHEQALFCYYDAFLTSVEPKNYKDALTQACWIQAMQEE